MQHVYQLADSCNEFCPSVTSRSTTVSHVELICMLPSCICRAGIVEPLEVMFKQLTQLHRTQRYLPAIAAHERLLQQLRHRRAAACDAVCIENEHRVLEAKLQHAQQIDNTQQRNKLKVCI